MHAADGSRPWTFYAFAAFFSLFVLFLYGPMIVIYVLSFQGPNGGMTFPLNGVSLHWFDALVSQSRVGDIAGSFQRFARCAVSSQPSRAVRIAGSSSSRQLRVQNLCWMTAMPRTMPGVQIDW